MAKSLRSKWKRKMRAVKRVRYGVKELAKLKEVVANSVDNLPNKHVQELEPMTTAATIPHKPKRQRSRPRSRTNELNEEAEVQAVAVEKMDVDVRPKKYTHLKDESGNYPNWLHPRKIRKIKYAQKARVKKNKRLNRK